MATFDTHGGWPPSADVLPSDEAPSSEYARVRRARRRPAQAKKVPCGLPPL